VANPEDTIDPNDLDSIDALLDEAEWNVDEDLEDAVPDIEDSDSDNAVEEASNETPADEEPSVDEFDLDSIDSELENSQEVEPEEVTEEVTEAPTEEVTEPPVEEVTQAPVEDMAEAPAEDLPESVTSLSSAGVTENKLQEKKQEPEVEPDDEFERKLAQRQSAQSKQSNDLTVEEMDTLKKLIIIFGSISIVLLLTAIGIATWGALSASSAGISEENQTLFESIKVSSDLNAEIAKANTEAADSLEKKVDAINFQIEQLAVDIAGLSKHAPAVEVAKQGVIDPLGLNKEAPKQVAEVQTPAPIATPVQPQKVNVEINSEITKKVSSVNYKLIKAQKTINELSKRLKAVQTQQQQMLKSVKTVEKEMLAEKSEKLKAQKQAEKNKGHGAYQYGPNDGFYDQGGQGSYP